MDYLCGALRAKGQEGACHTRVGGKEVGEGLAPLGLGAWDLLSISLEFVFAHLTIDVKMKSLFASMGPTQKKTRLNRFNRMIGMNQIGGCEVYR